MAGSTFLSRQHLLINACNHRLSIRDHGLGVRNFRLGIRDCHVGIDHQLGLWIMIENDKFAISQPNQLNTH